MAQPKKTAIRDVSSQEEMTREEIKSTMKSNLSENKYGKLEESLEAMKSVRLSIGITGPSGAGKSSFINNLHGLEENDEGAAEIGEGDTDASSQEEMTKEEIISKMKSFLSENKYGKLEESLEAMKSVRLSIGITGPSAVGKSSFINKMLGLEEGDEGAAEIGEGDTTTERKGYMHPQNTNLEFFDLPGFGTPSFKMDDKYLKVNDVEGMDFFLIFYSTTISEGDIWMIGKLINLKKNFALVRTRADDLQRRKSPKSLEQHIEEIKMKARKNLTMSGIKHQVEIFVISNPFPDIGEFDQLFDYIQENLPEIKREAIVIYVNGQTEKIIDMKRKVLENRAWKAAGCMGVASAVPIPGVDIPINLGILATETSFYLETFGFTEEIMQKIPDAVLTKLETVLEIRKEGLNSFIKSYLTKAPILLSATVVQQAVEMLIPIIGSLITGSAAFAYYVNFLRNLIRKIAEDAKILRNFHVESFMKKR